MYFRLLRELETICKLQLTETDYTALYIGEIMSHACLQAYRKLMTQNLCLVFSKKNKTNLIQQPCSKVTIHGEVNISRGAHRHSSTLSQYITFCTVSERINSHDSNRD
jgi:hypothetical protein